MTLSAGSRLLPSEIVSPLGAGGMGEVYRARDTRLHRDRDFEVIADLRPLRQLRVAWYPPALIARGSDGLVCLGLHYDFIMEP